MNEKDKNKELGSESTKNNWIKDCFLAFLVLIFVVSILLIIFGPIYVYKEWLFWKSLRSHFMREVLVPIIGSTITFLGVAFSVWFTMSKNREMQQDDFELRNQHKIKEINLQKEKEYAKFKYEEISKLRISLERYNDSFHQANLFLQLIVLDDNDRTNVQERGAELVANLQYSIFNLKICLSTTTAGSTTRIITKQVINELNLILEKFLSAYELIKEEKSESISSDIAEHLSGLAENNISLINNIQYLIENESKSSYLNKQ